MATPSSMTSATGYQAMRQAQLIEFSGQWARRRPWLLAPLVLATILGLSLSGFPRERTLMVALLYGALLLYELVAAARASRGSGNGAVLVEHLVTIGVHGVALALTGGLSSPLTPAILGPSVGTILACGRCRITAITVAFVGSITIALMLMPEVWLGPPIPYSYTAAIAGVSVLYALVLLRSSIVVLTDAYGRAGERLEQMREDILVHTKNRACSLESIGAKVAHELKNPLASVKGLVQLMARGSSDEETLARLEVMAAEITRMESILKDYLSFSRPLEDLRYHPVELGVLVDEVIAVLEGRAQNAGIRLERSGGGATVVGDGRRLKEAMLNLIANGLEATESGGDVRVDVHSEVEGGAEVLISDSGKGMTPELLARVGTPFFTTRQDGTGLGVVLARTVVKQHGGELEYQSEPNRGTKVRIRLPFDPLETRDLDGKAAAGR